MNPLPWIDRHTMIVRQIKKYVRQLPCIVIPSPDTFKIVEIDASEIGYGGILKQIAKNDAKEQIVRFHSGSWSATQQNYSTIKKEILFIILCVSKFQNDLFNQNFLIRVDCKSAKEVLQKDVQNLVSKQSFAQMAGYFLSVFDFDIEYIKGETNSILDFITREFLQGR